ncbi:hypothetical protein SAMN05444149_102687 [Pseudosulfitobacter pseudonitzschiae]|nr:hypothetical protein SAMN05444149_102687 [Pseudosulfitobacter pseudonitzschiae]
MACTCFVVFNNKWIVEASTGIEPVYTDLQSLYDAFRAPFPFIL